MDEKEQAKRNAYRRQYSRVKDFKELFESPQGKKVLLEIMKFSGFIHTTFNRDPYENSYRNGRRDLCGWILHNMKLNEQHVLHLIEEIEKNESATSSGDYA